MIAIHYVPQKQLEKELSLIEQQGRRALLVLEHAPQASVLHHSSGFAYQPPLLQQLSGLYAIDEQPSAGCCELWTAEGYWQQGHWPVQHVSDCAIDYCFNEHYLLGCLSIELPVDYSLEQYSNYFYQQINAFINTQQKPNLLRMWNYFPDINAQDNQLERYQQFCVGRYHAFENTIEQYPAASAVGSYSANPAAANMVLLFIATFTEGGFVENPNQLSAYNYPASYSPKSPSFARAAVYPLAAASQQLYISGTASIVGHQSLFQGDIQAQTRQILKNLETLIRYTNEQQRKLPAFSIHASATFSPAIKVYLRHPDDLLKVRPIIAEFLPDDTNVCYLHADICRRELDIEIELLIHSS